MVVVFLLLFPNVYSSYIVLQEKNDICRHSSKIWDQIYFFHFLWFLTHCVSQNSTDACLVCVYSWKNINNSLWGPFLVKTRQERILLTFLLQIKEKMGVLVQYIHARLTRVLGDACCYYQKEFFTIYIPFGAKGPHPVKLEKNITLSTSFLGGIIPKSFQKLFYLLRRLKYHPHLGQSQDSSPIFLYNKIGPFWGLS